MSCVCLARSEVQLQLLGNLHDPCSGEPALLLDFVNDLSRFTLEVFTAPFSAILSMMFN